MDPDAAGAPRICVIGVGSRFRRDDAAGWAVVARLGRPADRHLLPPGTQLHVCDGDPARLVAFWEGADLAVVADAARAVPARPGTVHRLRFGDGRPAGLPATTSSHGFGLADALGLAASLGRLPRRLVVYAIEAGDMSYGTGLSLPVAAAVRVVAAGIRRDLAAAAGARPGAVAGQPCRE
ncbi:hydrogenase maturation protease [Actinacidiphila acidipaludis]|uniref:Hydrogenase maturation protease n=1 Tax=Actinacidiphila acidipaludis TaxID=2873382 RepID=A0ABS7Q1C6_9ACTN|nr:hydrogenase maturation protease [Streptomyces acidipaludis]MBY8876255.1 hydrogenase maturation protease [Streptomyces acidipaludis]